MLLEICDYFSDCVEAAAGIVEGGGLWGFEEARVGFGGVEDGVLGLLSEDWGIVCVKALGGVWLSHPIRTK